MSNQQYTQYTSLWHYDDYITTLKMNQELVGTKALQMQNSYVET